MQEPGFDAARVERILARLRHEGPTAPRLETPLATRALADGRLLLVGRTLRETRAGAPLEERVLPDAASVRAVLAERFGIRLPPGAEAAL